MITPDWVETRLQRMADWVGALVYSVARYTTITRASANGESDKVAGQPNNADERAVDDEVRRLGSGGWGLAAVPPASEPCLVVRAAGGPTNGFIVACGSKRYFPANMAAGDVVLYSTATGLQLYLKASDGSFTLTDKLGGTVKGDGTGKITVTGNGSPGCIQLGSVILGDVLIKTQAQDSMGVPVTQFAPTNVQVG